MNATARRLARIAKRHETESDTALAALCRVTARTLARWRAGTSRPSPLAIGRLAELDATPSQDTVAIPDGGRGRA